MAIYGLSVTYFFVYNLVAQVPDLNLAENVSNLLSNREALNKQPTLCISYPSQNNGLEKFMFPNVKKVVKFQNGKNKSNTVIQYNIINTKNLFLSYKFVNKKYHDKLYSGCQWKNLL